MDTIFINSKHSKTSDPHRLLLLVKDKINLKRSGKTALTKLSVYYTWNNIKCHTKRIHLIYLRQHRTINLNYLMDHILCYIFKIIMNTSSKSH